MRTSSFSGGDSGDKALFTIWRRVPTTKSARGNTGDKFTGREAGFAYPHCPQFPMREWGHTGTLCLLGCPHWRIGNWGQCG